MPKDRHIELIARGVLRHGQWLLVCQSMHRGYYYLPGGHVEFGEAAATALTRELEEEAGLPVRVGPLAFVHETAFVTGKKPHHELNLVFHVEQTSRWDGSSAPQEVRSREPDIAFEWLDLASLSDIDLRPAAIRAWLLVGPTPAPDRPEWVSSFPSINLS